MWCVPLAKTLFRNAVHRQKIVPSYVLNREEPHSTGCSVMPPKKVRSTCTQTNTSVCNGTNEPSFLWTAWFDAVASKQLKHSFKQGWVIHNTTFKFGFPPVEKKSSSKWDKNLIYLFISALYLFSLQQKLTLWFWNLEISQLFQSYFYTYTHAHTGNVGLVSLGAWMLRGDLEKRPSWSRQSWMLFVRCKAGFARVKKTEKSLKLSFILFSLSQVYSWS